MKAKRVATMQNDSDDDADIITLPTLRAPIRFGERLIRENIITPDELHIALLEQKKNGAMLGATLTALGFCDQETLARQLASHAGVSYLDLSQIQPDLNLLRQFTAAAARRYMALPLSLSQDTLAVALADPFDLMAQDEIRRCFPRNVTLLIHVISAGDLLTFLDRLGEQTDTIDLLLGELENTGTAPAQASQDHPIIRLVDHLLADAHKLGASDIHFAPEESFARISFRIDGTLRQVRAVHLTHWPALSHRLKIMAGMNIADTRSIQDGRFQKQLQGNAIDFRVAIMPTVWGETIVVRLLDHKRSLVPLDDLGYSRAAAERLKLIAQKPQGITLITGPTGSGKTTTLYSILKQISTLDVHIATLEDPVEYQLDLIRQTTIQDDQGLGFAEGVRGVLRMDPDILLIGEIRDPDTAGMALRAAMTGHQVYTTLHSSDALGALPRLMDLGLNPRVLAGNLSGLIAQRLVRKLCPHCAHERAVTDEEHTLLQMHDMEKQTLAAATGCAACGYTGRMGRTVIAEVLPLTTALDDLIAAGAPRGTLYDEARKEGFTTMQQDGLAKVFAGEISLGDLRRAVDMSRGFSSRGAA